jgi:hypothetical protein
MLEQKNELEDEALERINSALTDPGCHSRENGNPFESITRLIS